MADLEKTTEEMRAIIDRKSRARRQRDGYFVGKIGLDALFALLGFGHIAEFWGARDTWDWLYWRNKDR